MSKVVNLPLWLRRHGTLVLILILVLIHLTALLEQLLHIGDHLFRALRWS
jgi:hypothetical protein